MIISLVISLGSGCFFMSSLPVKLLGKQWGQWPWGLSALLLLSFNWCCWTQSLKLPFLHCPHPLVLNSFVGGSMTVKLVQGSYNETGNHELSSKKVASNYLFIYFFLHSSYQKHNSSGETRLEVYICTREWCLFPCLLFSFLLVAWWVAFVRTCPVRVRSSGDEFYCYSDIIPCFPNTLEDLVFPWEVVPCRKYSTNSWAEEFSGFCSISSAAGLRLEATSLGG